MKTEPKPTNEIMDPAQCPYRETCPSVMQCVTEFIAHMTKAEWGLHDAKDDEDGQAPTEEVG